MTGYTQFLLVVLLVIIPLVFLWQSRDRPKEKKLHCLIYHRSIGNVASLQPEIAAVIASKGGELVDVHVQPMPEGDRHVVVVTVLYRS